MAFLLLENGKYIDKFSFFVVLGVGFWRVRCFGNKGQCRKWFLGKWEARIGILGTESRLKPVFREEIFGGRVNWYFEGVIHQLNTTILSDKILQVGGMLGGLIKALRGKTK
ncbi:hypothetical protein BKI52_09510 [marine bacterium AO1-C]|nr:hypothetical protein BKI52_09510 [marine bacterium AO1-C]